MGLRLHVELEAIDLVLHHRERLELLQGLRIAQVVRVVERLLRETHLLEQCRHAPLHLRHLLGHLVEVLAHLEELVVRHNFPLMDVLELFV